MDNPDSIFDKMIELIENKHSELGYKFGWRFLYSPKSTFSANAKLMFIGLNPGGSNYQAIPSVEEGNAYRVERNWSSDGVKLQQEVNSLFLEIARKLKNPSVDKNSLMDSTLTSNFCPFKSETWKELPNQDAAVNFSLNLWSSIFDELSINPSVIICMGKEPHKYFQMILVHLKYAVTSNQHKPTGWGNITYTVTELTSDSKKILMVRIPHLSRFKIISSRKCTKQASELTSVIAERLNNT